MSEERELVQAFRILVDLSDQPEGPALPVALQATQHLKVPEGWVKAVLKGWQRYYKRYGKPKNAVLVKKTPARFLAPRMLCKINLQASQRPCRLCGLEVPRPARSWHKACWSALEPETAQGWKTLCEEVYKRDKYTCQTCHKDVLDFRAAARYNKRPYSVDHKVALCLGGKHQLDNLQLLCVECHKLKSKEDLGKLAGLRKQLKGQKNDFN